MPSVSTLGRCASVTGKLEVRLMGCQDLLEEVPGRSRRDKDASSSPGDLRSFVKGRFFQVPTMFLQPHILNSSPFLIA